MSARAGAVLGLMIGSTVAFAPAAHGQAVAAAAEEADAPHATESVLAQRAGLVAERLPLTEALMKLAESSGVVLAFSPSLASEVSHVVSCDCSNRTVGQALTELLEATPFAYAEVKRQVMIYLATPPEPALELVPTRPSGWRGRFVGLVSATRVPTSLPLSSPSHVTQEGPVAGTVVDGGTMTPIEGAQVMVEGTSRGVVTDAAGRFRFDDLSGDEVTLRVERIGFRTASRVARVGALDVRFELEESVIALDELVVTGTLTPTKVKATPTPVSVITSAEIQRSNAHRIDQLFRGQIPGAIAYEVGTFDFVSRVTFRGGSSLSAADVPKVYVDGIELASPAFMSQLDPSSIERVEVVRGPQAATLYGSEALSGVIQIFTKKGRLGAYRPEVLAKVALSSIESRWVDDRTAQRDVAVSVSGGGDELSYNLGATAYHQGEYAPNYAADRKSVYAGLGGKLGPVNAEFSGRFYQMAFESPQSAAQILYQGEAAPTHTLPYDRTRTGRTATTGVLLQYAPTSNFHNSVRVGLDRFWQDIVTNSRRVATPDDTMYFNYIASQTKVSFAYTGAVEWSFTPRIGSSLTFGADYSSYYGTYAGANGANPHGVFNGTYNYIARDEWDNSGFYAQNVLDVNDALFLTGGVRVEHSPNFGDDYGVAVAPRAGVSYVVETGSITAKARASHGKAIKPPNPQQKLGSFTGTIILASPQLGPEVALGGDFGIDLHLGNRLSLSATYYNQRATDLIDLVYIDPASEPRVYQYQNAGEVENDGWELEATGLAGPLKLSGSFSVMNTKVNKLADAYTGSLLPGDRLLDVPRYSGGASVEYSLPRGYLRLDMMHMGAHTSTDWLSYYAFLYGLAPYRGSLRDYWTEYPAFEKFNVGAGFNLTDNLDTFLQVQNLFNSDAVELDNNYQTPGRITTLGVRVKL